MWDRLFELLLSESVHKFIDVMIYLADSYFENVGMLKDRFSNKIEKKLLTLGKVTCIVIYRCHGKALVMTR